MVTIKAPSFECKGNLVDMDLGSDTAYFYFSYHKHGDKYTLEVPNPDKQLINSINSIGLVGLSEKKAIINFEKKVIEFNKVLKPANVTKVEKF